MRDLPSRRWILGTCGLGLLLLATAPCIASAEDPAESFLRSADEAFRVASRNYSSNVRRAVARTTRVVSLFFDVPAMAQETVGPLWGEATQAERNELVGFLTDWLARQVARERSRTDRVSLVFVDRRELGDGSFLMSAHLSAEGRSRSVTWRLVRRDSGFRIVDVVGEAGGIIADLRARFTSFSGQPNGIRRFSKYLAGRS